MSTALQKLVARSPLFNLANNAAFDALQCEVMLMSRHVAFDFAIHSLADQVNACCCCNGSIYSTCSKHSTLARDWL